MYEIGRAEIEAVTKVIRSGKLMRDFGGTGSWCERFEAALAEKVGVKYAVTTCSGTSALIGASSVPVDASTISELKTISSSLL